MQFQGCANFRQRVVSSILSGKRLKITEIRADDNEMPGIQDFEACFLRLIDQITDGTRIEINETGTTFRMVPGIITCGLDLVHDCGTSRSIGWFIEGILPLVCLGKHPLNIILSGITHDTTGFSTDALINVTLPLLRRFGMGGATIEVKTRGFPPNGGGSITFQAPMVREVDPIHMVDMGLIKRVRGSALAARVSPTLLTRVVDSARGVLNNYIPDVYIHSDHHRTKTGGNSPGYSFALYAESTTGIVLSAERKAEQGELPEDVGTEGAILLLDEIKRGGVVDTAHQVLALQIMILGPEDVCKIRFGELSEVSIEVLRLLKEAFGIVFKIRRDADTDTVLLSCNGIGYQNISRKVR